MALLSRLARMMNGRLGRTGGFEWRNEAQRDATQQVVARAVESGEFVEFLTRIVSLILFKWCLDFRGFLRTG